MSTKYRKQNRPPVPPQIKRDLGITDDVFHQSMQELVDLGLIKAKYIAATGQWEITMLDGDGGLLYK